MWLLYYSPIVLPSLLNSEVFEHWLLLVRGISLLLHNVVVESDLNDSNHMLNQFVNLIPKIYGESHCSYNCHLLTHFPRFCKQLGPLQWFSMAPFETFNNFLIKSVKSSNCVTSQVAKKFLRKHIADCSKVEYSDGFIGQKSKLPYWDKWIAHIAAHVDVSDLY